MSELRVLPSASSFTKVLSCFEVAAKFIIFCCNLKQLLILPWKAASIASSIQCSHVSTWVKEKSSEVKPSWRELLETWERNCKMSYKLSTRKSIYAKWVLFSIDLTRAFIPQNMYSSYCLKHNSWNLSRRLRRTSGLYGNKFFRWRFSTDFFRESKQPLASSYICFVCLYSRLPLNFFSRDKGIVFTGPDDGSILKLELSDKIFLLLLDNWLLSFP